MSRNPARCRFTANYANVQQSKTLEDFSETIQIAKASSQVFRRSNARKIDAETAQR
jgi:hypothetical protein